MSKYYDLKKKWQVLIKEYSEELKRRNLDLERQGIWTQFERSLQFEHRPLEYDFSSRLFSAYQMMLYLIKALPDNIKIESVAAAPELLIIISDYIHVNITYSGDEFIVSRHHRIIKVSESVNEKVQNTVNIIQDYLK